MKLHRTLFYTLLSIFILGIVIICIVDSASVWSRIGVGLITGSFVGAINTLVNYFHQRQKFLENISMTALDLAQAVIEDFISFKCRIETFNELSKEERIKFDSINFQMHLDETRAFRTKYEKFQKSLDASPYASMVFINRVPLALSQLEDAVSSIKRIESFLTSSYSLGVLATNMPEDEQEMAVGDLDEFYEFSVRENYDCFDLYVFVLSTLSQCYSNVRKEIKGYVDKNHIDIWDSMSYYMKSVIKGYKIRDVFKERSEELNATFSLGDTE